MGGLWYEFFFLLLDSKANLTLSRSVGLPSDAITVESIHVSPDPPVPGKELTVTAVGRANEVIEVCATGFSQ